MSNQPNFDSFVDYMELNVLRNDTASIMRSFYNFAEHHMQNQKMFRTDIVHDLFTLGELIGHSPSATYRPFILEQDSSITFYWGYRETGCNLTADAKWATDLLNGYTGQKMWKIKIQTNRINQTVISVTRFYGKVN